MQVPLFVQVSMAYMSALQCFALCSTLCKPESIFYWVMQARCKSACASAPCLCTCACVCIPRHCPLVALLKSIAHLPVRQVKRLDARLRKADADAQLFNAREGLLGLPITDYSHVKNLIDQFDPFLQFWTTSSTWRVRGLGVGGHRCVWNGQGAKLF